MKINLYGSNANMAYLVAKFLRRKGEDARVFIDQDPEFQCNLPHWEESDLKELPSWVEPVRVNLRRIAYGGTERKFIRKLSECDIIHVIGEAGIWASFTNKPYLYWSYGFDLDILPFKRGSLKNYLLSRLQRRTLSKAGLILYPIPHQREFLVRLGLNKSQFFLPMVPLDMEKYSKRAGLNQLRDSFSCKWLFLHPSRQEWTRDIPDNKGCDKLFRAFSRFIKDGHDAKMLVFEKGRDVADSKKLIDRLGIKENIVWLREQNKERLINLYSISDMVFDQFNIGSPGLISWEALSVGVPTFVYLKDFWKECTEELPPVINVSTEDQIYSMINKVSDDEALRREISIRSRNWIAKYFHWEKVIEQYIQYYKDVLDANRV